MTNKILPTILFSISCFISGFSQNWNFSFEVDTRYESLNLNRIHFDSVIIQAPIMNDCIFPDTIDFSIQNSSGQIQNWGGIGINLIAKKEIYSRIHLKTGIRLAFKNTIYTVSDTYSSLYYQNSLGLLTLCGEEEEELVPDILEFEFQERFSHVFITFPINISYQILQNKLSVFGGFLLRYSNTLKSNYQAKLTGLDITTNSGEPIAVYQFHLSNQLIDKSNFIGWQNQWTFGVSYNFNRHLGINISYYDSFQNMVTTPQTVIQTNFGIGIGIKYNFLIREHTTPSPSTIQ